MPVPVICMVVTLAAQPAVAAAGPGRHCGSRARPPLHSLRLNPGWQRPDRAEIMRVSAGLGAFTARVTGENGPSQ